VWERKSLYEIRKHFKGFLLSFLSVVAIADPVSNQAASRIWITDVTIVSPENLDRIGTGSVLIENAASSASSETLERRSLLAQRWFREKGNFYSGPHRLARPPRFCSRDER